MKEGWTYKKLGEICDINCGNRVVRNRDGGSIYPVYGGGGVTFRMNSYNREDCLIISRFAMSERCTRFVRGKFFLNDSGLSLSVKKADVLQSFINWQILHLNDTIYKLGRGAAQKNLDTKAFAELLLVYPIDINRQQQIVDRLDTAFAKIEAVKTNAEKQLNDAKALFKKELSKAMTPKEGWEEKKLGEIGDVIGGTTPNTNNPDYWDGDICWISPAELHGERYLYDSVKKITQEAVNAKSLKELPVGTVILSSRAPIGKVAINKVPMYCNQGFKCIVCGKEVYNEFLYWWLWGNTDYLNSLGTGATFKEISKSVVEKIQIPIPALSVQQAIVTHLDTLSEKLKTVEEKQKAVMAECDAMKQALLREVFE